MRSMLFNIMSTDRNGEPVIRKVVDISQPRSNGEPRKIGENMTDHLKAALRMYGCRAIHSKGGDVYAVGSRSGKRIWAEPVNVTVKPAKVKKNKGKNKPEKVKSQKVNVPADFDPTIHATGPNGEPVYRKDGVTLALRRGRKPATVTVKSQDVPDGFDPAIHAVDSDGNPVFKNDGTLAKRRGRKPANQPVKVKSQKVNSKKGKKNKGNKSLSPKDEFNAMLDGSIPMNEDRLRELTALIVAAA